MRASVLASGLVRLVASTLALVACASSQEPWRYGPLPDVHAPWLARKGSKPLAPASDPSASPSALPSTTPSSAPSVEPSASGSPSALLVPPPAPAFTPSPALRAKHLRSPIPGGVFAGYAGDTGLDLVTKPRPVHALAAATVDYAEKGHTRWVGPHDTPYCVRLTLDEPIPWKNGRKITHVYYAHLSALAFEQKEGAKDKRHVAAGEPLGTSGVARGVPHLHLGLLLDGQVEQDDWTYILREGEVRTALGGYANGETL